MASEATYTSETRTLKFAIYPDGFDGPRILAVIAADVMHERFGAQEGSSAMVTAYESSRELIDAEALGRYRDDPSTPVELTSRDFELLR